MDKLTKALRNRRGVTLVELIITMALFSIITAAAAALLPPTLASYAKANELAELNTLLDTLTTELSAAMAGIDTEPTLSTDGTQITLTTGTNSATYSTNNGVLFCQRDSGTAQAVLQGGYYKNKQLAVAFTYTVTPATPTVPASAIIQTTLSLTLADGGTLDRSFSVKPLILNQ